MCYCRRVLPVDYRTDHTCAPVDVRHVTTDRHARTLPTSEHARPRVHRAGCSVNNFCARQSTTTQIGVCVCVCLFCASFPSCHWRAVMTSGGHVRGGATCTAATSGTRPGRRPGRWCHGDTCAPWGYVYSGHVRGAWLQARPLVPRGHVYRGHVRGAAWPQARPP